MIFRLHFPLFGTMNLMHNRIFIPASLTSILLFLFLFSGVVSAQSDTLKDDLLNRGVVIRGAVGSSASQTQKPEQLRTQSKIDQSQPASQTPYDDLVMIIQKNDISAKSKAQLLTAVEELTNQQKTVTLSESQQMNLLVLQLEDSQEQLTALQDSFSQDASITVAENRVYKTTGSPNDTYYGDQWYLNTIDFEPTYDRGNGSDQVTIAVLDNGLNIADAELDSSIWVNTDETAGNGIDDDGNGYIDDRNGCNFVEYRSGNTNGCATAQLYDAGQNHGTNTGLLMAAQTNNSAGIASVCPSCDLMVLDVDDTGSASTLSIIDALNYAVDNGADIINFSYTSFCPYDAGSDTLATILDTVINTEGIVFVQSAGNYGDRSEATCNSDCPSNSYCSSAARHTTYYYIDGKQVENKINVAATDASNNRASFSNYDGTSEKATTIAAPGTSLPVYINGSLTTVNGTSFASPLVAGSIGRVLTYTKSSSNPSPSQLYSALRTSATSISTDQDISGLLLNLTDYVDRMVQDSSGGDSDSGSGSGGSSSGDTAQNSLADRTAVYRFYSPRFQTYFYTPGVQERDQIIQNYDSNTWTYQGVAYYSFVNSFTRRIPVYRFWSERFQVHFYTSGPEERDYVRRTYDEQTWKYEGIAMYVYSPAFGGSRKPVHRFWSDQYQTHFYTASTSELNSFKASNNWRYEGVAWYVPY